MEEGLEPHMQYDTLDNLQPDRMNGFMSRGWPRRLEQVPGIGGRGVEILASLGIETPNELAGKFMSLDRDCALMVAWLEEHRFGRPTETVVRALAAKLHQLLG
jgi:nucleotidyltransferase/DNA polymerase involved in DNA repair